MTSLPAFLAYCESKGWQQENAIAFREATAIRATQARPAEERG